MSDWLDDIASLTGATQASRGERLQSLWSGYGELVRVRLEGANVPSVVVKRVTPPKGASRIKWICAGYESIKVR